MKRVKKRIKFYIALFFMCFVGGFLTMNSKIVFAAQAPKVEIVAHNLSLGDTTHILYAVKAENIEKTDRVGVLCWDLPQKEYKYGTQTETLSFTGTENIGGAEYLKFVYKDFSAKQMTDVIYSCAYLERSGVYYYSEVDKYSILEYAYNKLGKTEAVPTEDEKLKTLLTEMLEYGGAAQEYHDYHTERLADADYTYVRIENAVFADGFDYGFYKEGEKVSIIPNNGYLLSAEASDCFSLENKEIFLTVPANTFIGEAKNFQLRTDVLDGGKCGETLNWELLGDGTLRIFGTGKMYDYVKYTTPAPWYKYRNEPYLSQDGKKILNPDGTEYLSAESYFADNPLQYKITNFIIEEGVTYIGDWAFYRVCVDELTIPEGVISTGYFCVRYSPTLKTVTLPDSLQLLNDFGISRNQVLKQIHFGEGLTTVGRCALAQNGALESVFLPDSVTSINEFQHEKYNNTAGDNLGLLDGCTSLRTLYLGKPNYIPQRTCLNNSALQKIVIPNTVTHIEEYAFANCSSLKTVVFEAGSKCTLIKAKAFLNATAIESITGCEALETIEENAFNAFGLKALKEFEFSERNQAFAAYLFSATKLESARMGNRILELSPYLFMDSSIEELYVSKSVGVFGEHALRNCKYLAHIYYGGTEEDWRRIEKGAYWHLGTASGCVVHFSDGNKKLLKNINE